MQKTILNSNVYTFKYVYNTSPIKLNSEQNMWLKVRHAVINSVERRLDTDRPFGFLVSGGVDSSLVAGIAYRLLGHPLKTFCCGMSQNEMGQGTDLVYARMVAEHIKSNHTEVFFTPEEGLNAIEDVIWSVETWDGTTTRASVGQYLVCKHIGTKTDIKVVFIGEGPDEICSSYLFNWHAPNAKALDDCSKEYVEENHKYDIKRSDKCIRRWGMEGRPALLDPEFIEAYWEIPAKYRMPSHKGVEKWWLRKAFEGTNIIPDEVLWRKKEAFSDGVSSKEKSWFQYIQEHVETKVSDEDLKNAPTKYPYCTPVTKETYYYSEIFCAKFGEKRQKIIQHYWQPKWDSSGSEITKYVDPSARTLKVYDE